MKNFKDKIIVITGAASGMGKSYAVAFAKLGAKLALCDLDKNGLLDVKKECCAIISEENIYTEILNIAEKDAVFGFADNVKSALGNAHVIINNAGVEGSYTPIYSASLDNLKKIMDINFFGVVYGTKAFLPQLVENNEGAVVNVSSVFGLVGPPDQSDYVASKFAVRGFTESLMAEFHKSPISIHSLHPGGINTNIIKNEKYKNIGKRVLITPPDKVVQYVIKCIRKRKPKIVCGYSSKWIWFAANFIPKKFFIPIIQSLSKKGADKKEYQKFNPGFLE